MGTTVVIEGVMANELPEAWRRRVKAKGGADRYNRQTQDEDRRKDETQCDLRHVG